MTIQTVTISAYQFLPLQGLPEMRIQVREKCQSLNLCGTVLIAPEGINCFLYGTVEKVRLFKEYLGTEFQILNLCYKENPIDANPFKRLLVKIKKEIITMGVPEIKPSQKTAPRLSPKELKTWLDSGKPVVLLDTRNEYEISVGTFKNAIRLGIDAFRDFPQSVDKLPEEMKQQPIVTFCTGGIRCEKASAFMLNKGFKDVYQLDGGILKYFEECQSSYYEGNCFVFDWRLAVDSNFNPQGRSSNDPINSGRHVFKSSGDPDNVDAGPQASDPSL